MHPFAPRDPVAAARWLRTVLLLSAGLLALTTVVAGGSAAVVAVCAVTAATCLAGAVAVTRGWLPGGRSWAVAAFGTPSLVLVADLATRDASVTGQVFFLLPALVAGAHLRRAGAWWAAAASSAGELVLVTALLPLGTALVHWLHISAFVAVLCHLLVRAGERSDALTAELRRQAAVDPLTGLVTRRVLDDAASAALTGVAAGVGTALVLVDLDRFKAVNDTHGHPVGDRALVHVGALLTAAAGPGAVVSRLGGDEMAALLPGSDLEAAEGVAHAVVAAVRAAPLALRGGGLAPLTVSAGVAHSPRHAADVEALYRAADAALYDAKRAGRDRAATARPVVAGAVVDTRPAAG